MLERGSSFTTKKTSRLTSPMCSHTADDDHLLLWIPRNLMFENSSHRWGRWSDRGVIVGVFHFGGLYRRLVLTKIVDTKIENDSSFTSRWILLW